MNIEQFIDTLKSAPDTISFETTMAVIDSYYTHTPSAFQNGDLHNSAQQNQGSCKLFAFAKLQKFNQQQTLACFGQYYRDDVLNNPGDDNHQNIRHFMIGGWQGISFPQNPLSPKI